MGDITETEKLVGYCGIYCGGCGIFKGRIISMVANDLEELIKIWRYAEWVPKFCGINFNFEEFQKGLAYLTKENSRCYCQESCKAGGGVPGCEIKKCAKRREVEICFQCSDYPCNYISQFLKTHPEKAEEYERFKKLGMDEWIKVQIQRAEKGYCQAARKYYAKAKAE